MSGSLFPWRCKCRGLCFRVTWLWRTLACASSALRVEIRLQRSAARRRSVARYSNSSSDRSVDFGGPGRNSVYLWGPPSVIQGPQTQSNILSICTDRKKTTQWNFNNGCRVQTICKRPDGTFRQVFWAGGRVELLSTVLCGSGMEFQITQVRVTDKKFLSAMQW